jgi:hypothetical protein
MAVIGHDMKNFNLAVNTHVDPRRVEAVDVGAERQLLVDDFLLSLGGNHEQYPRGIRWSVGPVEKHPAALFEGQAPWEESSAWLCVRREEGIYRMWYNSNQKTRRGMYVSYAESDDGVEFVRRNQGQVELEGTTDNNVVFDGGLNGISPEFGTVFIDPHALEGERYKMIYTDWNGPEVFDLPFTHNVGFLRGAASPDGIQWTRYYDNFLGRYCDSQNTVSWDETLGRYVAYHRTSAQYGGVEAGTYRVPATGRGRAVGRLESPDYRNWQSTGVALQADFLDGLNSDIYNSAYSRYPGSPHLHFMFPSFYRHYEGTFEVQVCTSRDNRNWFRACRDTFIPLGPEGAFDCFIVSVAPGFVEVDDDTLALYYRSGDGPHGGSRPIELPYTSVSRVGRVTFKRDRILGIEADPGGGQFITRPLRFEGGRLLLNVEPLGKEAVLRAQLVSVEDGNPVPGHTFDDCLPITEDSIHAPVVWGGRERIAPDVAAKPAHLHIQYRDMRLYAFQFGA